MNLATVIIYFALVAAVGGAIYGVYHSVDSALEHHYADPVREKATAVLAACNVEKDKAVAANVELTADLARVRIDIEASNIAFDELKKYSDRIRTARDAAKGPDNERLRALAMQNFDLVAALNAADTGGSCEQRMQRIDTTLRDLARQRVRDHPPAAAGGISSGATPGNQGTGADSVRIRP